MRRPSWLLLVGLIVIASVGLGVFWFVMRLSNDNEDAAAVLASLSKEGAATTYYARYGGTDPTEIGVTIYNAPGIGLRLDFAQPVDAKNDAKQENDVLKSGDIFIVTPDLRGTYLSCRTARRSCRAVDGLEVLVVLTFSSIFRYDQQSFFDQPHSVTTTGDISAAGETGKCFVIAARTGTANEQATAELSGFVPGVGLPKTFCYATDGVPLGGRVSDKPPNADWFKASEVTRYVDPSAFEPPFRVVPSVYDRTPTATP